MTTNLHIHDPERINDELEDFRLENLDGAKNYTAAKITLTRNKTDEKPLLFYTQELRRNFRDAEDPFSCRKRIKVFTSENLKAIADTTLGNKFQDTLLAFKPEINDYNPLTDIHSSHMDLFLDDVTATFLEDIGIRVNGLAEDFCGMESISATPYLEDIAGNARELKHELQTLRARYQLLKEEMVRQSNGALDGTSEEAFMEGLSQVRIPQALTQSFLSLREQITRLMSRLGEINQVIFSETRQKIRLPATIKETVDGNTSLCL